MVIALFLAISLEPVVGRLTRRGVPRAAAVAVIIGVLAVLSAAFIWSLVPPIVSQGGHLLHDAPGYLGNLAADSKAVREVTDRYHLTERLSAAVAALPSRLAGGAVGYFRRFMGAIGSTFTDLILTMYFIADPPRLRDRLVGLFPSRRRRRRAAEVADVLVDKVGGYMIGNIVISVIAGAATFACLELLRIPYALPLAVTIALADLIRMIGATLGATVCVVAALVTVGLWARTVILVVFFVPYQLCENYVLVARVFHNTVDMPAAVVLLVALSAAPFSVWSAPSWPSRSRRP
ncbi:AI-2E family transporter [Actinoplanes sp. CA-030573]|uniref:AI-2E family transporter n=1 Tax=Actinoplanes sp. CA-030573 TaxID=3239898 RepID=UPI003D8FD5E2